MNLLRSLRLRLRLLAVNRLRGAIVAKLVYSRQM